MANVSPANMEISLISLLNSKFRVPLVSFHIAQNISPGFYLKIIRKIIRHMSVTTLLY